MAMASLTMHLTKEQLFDLALEQRREIGELQHALIAHPTAQTLRFLAPFIRASIEAGTWAATPGSESVEHELAASLAWLDSFEEARA